jgi:protein-L-isoaspartate(D-aspartate) O-methyltransferase
LLAELRHDGIRDERVLEAIAAVPRDRFVPAHLREFAWENVALPIDAGQTISQPFIVAAMTSALQLRPDDRVLEIGTGSGYQAAILAYLAAEVCSIERHPELADIARATLRAAGIDNVTILVGDGTLGWPDAPPFDRMIVTAAGPELPPPLLHQLSPNGGRLVVPIGPHDGDQRLLLVTSDGGELSRHDLGPVRFVPLIGQEG